MVSYEEAKKLVNKGFSVIPIKGMDKVPAISSWKEFQKRKPSDEELHKYFDHGNKNIGVVCGKISGGADSEGKQYALIVIDFDDKENLEFLIKGGITKFIEKTLVAKTGKGFHVYFRVPEDLSETRRFENLKIDIKGEGSYAVAPPSIHKEGARYQFLNDKEIEYNDKFNRFLEKLEEKDQEFRYAKEVLPYWEPNKRNFLAVGLPIFLKQMEKWSLGKVTDLVLGINRMKPFPQDPYSDSELIAKVRNAYEKEYNYRPFLSDYIGADELLKTLERMTSKYTEKESENLHFPGPARVVKALMERYKFRTIPEIGSDREAIYYFNGKIWERAEEVIKERAHEEYIKQYKEVLETATKQKNKEFILRMEKAIDKGPSINDINEVLAMIRRTTFTHDEMNPPGYIPFRNGLLNLKTRKLEVFNPELFYTYQIDANLITDRHITLKDTPLFSYLLDTLFHPGDIPLVLSYSAYTLYPDLPIHKVLFIIGRERIGKGSFVKVLIGLMPKGSGSISLARLLTSDRFQFQGIEGKNLLLDMETKRKFRKGTILDWSAFTNLFSKDVLNVEPKGREAHDYISKAKGIFLGNLPFISIDSPPAISRILLVETKNERPTQVIPDIDKEILVRERDEIATLLVEILFKLIDNNFKFPLPNFVVSEQSEENPIDISEKEIEDKTAAILEKLADPVENFIEEVVEDDPDSIISYDEAYASFEDYCENKGIPTLRRQTFLKNFGFHYYRKRLGPRGNRTYYFVGCRIEPLEKKETKKNTKGLYQSVLNELLSLDRGASQVGHEVNEQETLKNSDSKNNKNGVQHGVPYPSRKEGNNENNKINNEDNEYNKRVSALKLDTNVDSQKSRENKGFEDNKPVSNLNENPDAKIQEMEIFRSLNDYHYFKSEEYFPDSYFNNYGIQNIEHKQSEHIHYYKIPYSEILEKKYYEFSSRFSSNSKVFVIDEKEFDLIERKEEKEK
jgi:phage/plasmid-associated DNA primase